jgi:hypothetical protein
MLAEKTPEDVAARMAGFSMNYVRDWETWLATDGPSKVRKFGKILRKWQATRPYPMRRSRDESDHAPPFLEDLIDEASPYLSLTRDATVANICSRSLSETEALISLWHIFARLPQREHASCVGRSKAIMLLTNGRIGPALDSNVRRQLKIPRITDGGEWVELLREIGSDIRAFEHRNAISLREAVPSEFRRLHLGRIYDMILGPRERPR